MPTKKLYYSVKITVDPFIANFMETYDSLIPNKAGFIREAIKHYIPIWVKKLETYDKFKNKYINEE